MQLDDTMQHLHMKAYTLEDITATKIETFLAQRIREDNIAPKTANRYREVLHRMFNFAIKNWNFAPVGRRNMNPAALVERRREPSPKIRFLSLYEIDKQLHILDSKPTLQAIVATYIYAGLRREEALWLTVNDVDLERHLIYVCAKDVNGEFWQPKTKRNRVVPHHSSNYSTIFFCSTQAWSFL